MKQKPIRNKPIPAVKLVLDITHPASRTTIPTKNHLRYAGMRIIYHYYLLHRINCCIILNLRLWRNPLFSEINN